MRNQISSVIGGILASIVLMTNAIAADTKTPALAEQTAPASAVANEDCDDATTCLKLAEKYGAESDEANADIQKAFKFAKKSCDLKNGEGCLQVAMLIAEIEEEPSLEEIRNYSVLGCDLGFANSCLFAAVSVFLNEESDYADPKEALKLMQRSCDLESASGCGFLGMMYAEGVGTEVDIKKGVKLMEQGCEGNDEDSCEYLGDLYYNMNSGIESDHNKAKEYYILACDLKNVDACNKLATVYTTSWQLKSNFKEATKALKKSCDLKNAEGCATLAYYSETGANGIPNPASAFRYRKLACQYGDEESCEKVKSLRTPAK